MGGGQGKAHGGVCMVPLAPSSADQNPGLYQVLWEVLSVLCSALTVPDLLVPDLLALQRQ